MVLIASFFHLFFLTRIISGSTVLPEVQECGDREEVIHERKGDFAIHPREHNRDPLRLSYVFANVSDMLIIDGDVWTNHKSEICDFAVDFLILPNGEKRCTTETFCKVYVPPDCNISLVESQCSPAFRLAVRRRCNTTWENSATWPPRVCVMKNFQQYRPMLHYSFITIKYPSKRSSPGKTETVQKVEQSSTAVIIVAVAVGTVLLLALALIVIYKRRQRAQPQDINPYAVHISERSRGQYVDEPLFERQPQENPYDTVAPGISVIETQYMNPSSEYPYSEIGNISDHETRRHYINDTVYDMANSVNSTSGYTAGSGSMGIHPPEVMASLMSSRDEPTQFHDNIRHSGYVEMSSNPSPQHSAQSLLEGYNTHTPYGDIIGTISQDGVLQRFHPTEEQYKSIRKPKLERKRSESV